MLLAFFYFDTENGVKEVRRVTSIIRVESRQGCAEPLLELGPKKFLDFGLDLDPIYFEKIWLELDPV